MRSLWQSRSGYGATAVVPGKAEQQPDQTMALIKCASSVFGLADRPVSDGHGR